MRKRGAVEKRERTVVAAAKLDHATDLAKRREADKNRDVRCVVVERPRRRKESRAKSQRRNERREVLKSQNHLCVFVCAFASLSEMFSSGCALNPTLPNHPSS